jgi:hypothetical protein
MTWIRTPVPPLEAVQAARKGLPAVYSGPKSDRVPELVRNDSIVLSHALVPGALAGMFGGYNALLSPDLPLDRRRQEMIAVVVSRINDCFY